MKSKLFDYVKEKALDDNTKNINVYIQDKNEPAIINAFYQKNIRSLSPSELAKYFLTPLFNTQITHSEFYKLVLKKIDEYQEKDLKPAPYLMVHNTYESIAELVAQLRAAHVTGSIQNAGLNMNNGTIGDMKSLGIIEPFKVKNHILTAATEAAEMIIRVDHINNNNFAEFLPPSPLIRKIKLKCTFAVGFSKIMRNFAP